MNALAAAAADEAARVARIDEFDDIVCLLMDHAAHASADTVRLARVVAQACLGENHLWQDLALPHRQALSDLLRENFPALCEKNTGNMRWKKFFYRQLCERAEIRACRSPSCGVCSDYNSCFGDEEAGAP